MNLHCIFKGSISIANPKQGLEDLKGAEEIVIAKNETQIVFDYPLREAFVFTETAPALAAPSSSSYFTRKALVQVIADRYKKIYDEERETSTIEETLIPGMDNRDETNGKYGIRLHVITDLYLERVWYNPITNCCLLDVGS